MQTLENVTDTMEIDLKLRPDLTVKSQMHVSKVTVFAGTPHLETPIVWVRVTCAP